MGLLASQLSQELSMAVVMDTAAARDEGYCQDNKKTSNESDVNGSDDLDSWQSRHQRMSSTQKREKH